MAAIVKSAEVQVRRTQYAVAGWGDGELWTSEDAVLAHEFRFDGAAGEPGAPLRGAESPSGTVALSAAQRDHDFAPTSRNANGIDPSDLVGLFGAFLAGAPVDFTAVPLDLDPFTPFQRSLAEVLRGLPRGDVVSYGELAALAGYPGAQRAAGTFCARNRFMFLVPCHRVVGADGIGGYGSAGVGVKRRLLALEGVRL
jgi:O-6-methylguanine DNA methyltransferase